MPSSECAAQTFALSTNNRQKQTRPTCQCSQTHLSCLRWSPANSSSHKSPGGNEAKRHSERRDPVHSKPEQLQTRTEANPHMGFRKYRSPATTSKTDTERRGVTDVVVMKRSGGSSGLCSFLLCGKVTQFRRVDYTWSSLCGPPASCPVSWRHPHLPRAL